mmetsp:Transcript_89953/g.199877  ORF Transcript_89953/g.199877 Transcript_89953/m.199877 type:complete len:215 (+) Transcript_89953:124-768(+)
MARSWCRLLGLCCLLHCSNGLSAIPASTRDTLTCAVNECDHSVGGSDAGQAEDDMALMQVSLMQGALHVRQQLESADDGAATAEVKDKLPSSWLLSLVSEVSARLIKDSSSSSVAKDTYKAKSAPESLVDAHSHLHQQGGASTQPLTLIDAAILCILLGCAVAGAVLYNHRAADARRRKEEEELFSTRSLPERPYPPEPPPPQPTEPDGGCARC